MKTASVNELKGELKKRNNTELVTLCLRLVRHKKENKELLTYLLFEAADPDGYIESIKEEIEAGFDAIHTTNLYFAKKGIRKTLRLANKYIRYTGSKAAEAEALIHFCRMLKKSDLPWHRSPALVNLYEGQIKKIGMAIATLHTDLQHDYRRILEELS